jgi:drug/metabolite transporter (DMT)-like permease
MLAHILVNRAFKHAEAAVVMPYQYSLLIWAILFGALFFDDTPRPAMLLGAGLIVASGLIIVRINRA